MTISVYQGRSPSLLCNVINIDTRLLGTHLLSSERQFLETFPDKHLWTPFFAFWPSYLKRHSAEAELKTLTTGTAEGILTKHLLE